MRLGREADAASYDASGAPCHAHIAGFDLYAGVAVPAGDRARLEHLGRYVLRPPIAQGFLAIAPDGRVRHELRRPWRDGTHALLFDPLDSLGRLAALTPKPRVNLLLYHGVFAPHADLLRRVFEIDVLHCAQCGGRLRFVAAIDDPEVVRRILGHLGLPTAIAPSLPARSPPGLTQESFDWA